MVLITHNWYKPMLDVRQAAAPETETTVVCRPTGGVLALFWVLIVVETLLLLCTFAKIFLSSGFIWSADLIGLLLLDACFMSLCVLTRLHGRRARLIADAKGLRWREAGRWQAATWEEVTAFYEYYPRSAGSSAKLRVQVKSPVGSFILRPAEWTAAAQMLEAIKQNARQVSGPGLVDARAKSSVLPLECQYDTAVNRNILGWMEKVHKYGLLAVAVYFALEWFLTHTLPGWGWLLTPTGLFVIAKQALPLCWRPMYSATQPRLDDKVFADKDGLRFVTGGSETAIAWGDIRHLYSLGIRSVVVTQDGSEYDFLSTLTDCDLLKSAIPRYAVNARYRGWRTGILERRQVTSRDGRQSEQCVHRYRSHYNCWVLWPMTVLATLIAVPPVLMGGQGNVAPAGREWVSLFLLSVLLPLPWLWGNYWRGGICTDEEGITQQTIFGRRFLPWGQVRAFHWRGSGIAVRGYVEGMDGTLTFLESIADPDRLVDEIAARGIMVR